MTDKPILFSIPMVRALWSDQKTQTRRLLMDREAIDKGPWVRVRGPTADHGWQVGLERFNSWKTVKVRHAVGDRLYVREPWRASYNEDYRDDATRTKNATLKPPREIPVGSIVEYLAHDDGELNGRDRRAMHMPRWASRMTLHVTLVRVQRLHDISEEDAIAEGVIRRSPSGDFHVPGVEHPNQDFPYLSRPTAREMYAALWDVINGSGAWLTNPWVTATTFWTEKVNIEQAAP